MKKNPSPKIAFRVSSETPNGYKHFSFQILKRDEYSETSMSELAVIRFQSDTTNQGWYAMRTTIETRDNPISHISEALKLIKKILPEDEREQTPETILAKMAELKIPRVEYDCRLSQYVTEKDCPDVNLSRWMDGYKQYNNDYGCSIAVLAGGEIEARDKITKEFCDSIAKGDSSATFEKWIAANKPVEENRHSIYRAASFSPIEEMMKPLN
jgi:hypothetical protein